MLLLFNILLKNIDNTTVYITVTIIPVGALILKRTVILVRKLMDGLFREDAHFSKDDHGRRMDAQPKFEDDGENCSCDGHGLASKSKEPM